MGFTSQHTFHSGAPEIVSDFLPYECTVIVTPQGMDPSTFYKSWGNVWGMQPRCPRDDPGDMDTKIPVVATRVIFTYGLKVLKHDHWLKLIRIDVLMWFMTISYVLSQRFVSQSTILGWFIPSIACAYRVSLSGWNLVGETSVLYGPWDKRLVYYGDSWSMNIIWIQCLYFWLDNRFIVILL